MKEYLRQLLTRKDLLLYLVSSGLKARHRNTVLGYVWWLLDPLLNLVIYYFVVGIVFSRGGPDYMLHLIVGLSAWRWFQATVNAATRSLSSQAGIISQVYLPKAVFPLGAVLAELYNFAFNLVVVALFLVAFRRIPGTEALWLPVIMVVQVLFMIALALPLAYVSVFVRDMGNLVNHLLRLWFYASPIIWRPTDIPANWQWVLLVNPVTHFLTAYQSVLLDHRYPDIVSLLIVAIPSVLVIAYSIYYYSRYEHRIIKVL